MDAEVMLGFGRHVSALRRVRRMTQQELADRAGLHRTYIGGVERGERNISLVNINRIAVALEVTLPALMAFTTVLR